MFKKIKQYYHIFGFKETIKKIRRYISFKSKTNNAKNGIYEFSKNEYDNIVLKKRKIYIFSSKPFNELQNNKLKETIIYLNHLGFGVEYYYTSNKRIKNELFPLSVHLSINSIMLSDLKISKDSIVIVDDIKDNLLKTIKKQNDKVYDATILTNDLLKNINDLHLFNDKCDKELYNNISIIVLNYNNKNIIDECLDLLIKNNERYQYEIIVVDNGSVDGSYEMIKKKYKSIKLIQNIKNGCASGRNLGVKNSSKDFIMFLDSDQLVQSPFWVDTYIDIIKNNNIGAIGWAAGFFNNQGYAFHTVDNFEYSFMPPMGLYRKDIGYIGSGGMMMKKSVFNAIDGFDEEYDPTCYEDTDISLKIRDYGKDIVYSPYLVLEHRAHQTTKSGSSEHEKLIMEKGNYFINKWKKKNPDLLRYRK